MFAYNPIGRQFELGTSGGSSLGFPNSTHWYGCSQIGGQLGWKVQWPCSHNWQLVLAVSRDVLVLGHTPYHPAKGQASFHMEGSGQCSTRAKAEGSGAHITALPLHSICQSKSHGQPGLRCEVIDCLMAPCVNVK